MRTAIAVLIVALAVSAAEAQDRRGGRGQRRDNSPKVGDKAPNFTATVLAKVKSEKREKPEKVELKKVIQGKQKPVILIFGSYT